MASIDLSIIVIVYNMQREAPRTLLSLSRAYQRELGDLNYEVIAVDNGSAEPLPDSLLKSLGPEFRYHRIFPGLPSPAKAMNQGIALAAGQLVGLMVDGARIATPGVLRYAALASRLADRPLIYTLGFHLGHEPQTKAFANGYNALVEDQLLADIGFPADGYRLFEIACLAGACKRGLLGLPSESNCVFLRRDDLRILGGFNEAFISPGGGLVNLDFFHRACSLPGIIPICLAGEGSFHQVHGGVTTNVIEEENTRRYATYKEEYRRLRGRDFVRHTITPLLLGRMTKAAYPFFKSPEEFITPVGAPPPHWLSRLFR